MNKGALRQGAKTNADRWLVVEVGCSVDLRNRVASLLFELGGSAVEELPGGKLATWIRPRGRMEVFAREVRATLDCRFPGRLDVTWRDVPSEDWLRRWRGGLAPRRIGERVVVAPSWTAPPDTTGGVLVRIDPEMAFGTGEHGSTRAAVRLLQTEVRADDRVLDLGTGSGILAIVAAKLGARVLALESDPEAASAAQRNARRNQVGGRVRVMQLHVDRTVLRLLRGSRFELLAVNVERRFIQPLLPDLRPLLSRGGELLAAGILAEEASAFLSAAHASSLELASQTVDDGWWAGLLATASSRL